MADVNFEALPGLLQAIEAEQQKASAALTAYGQSVAGLAGGQKLLWLATDLTQKATEKHVAGLKAAAAEGGKFGKVLKEVQGGMRAGAALFAAGAAGLTGFVAAASPSAMGAFGGVVQLVAGEIGLTLVPYLMQAVEALQRFADWWDSLSDGTKQAAASVAAYAVAGLGVVALVGRLGGALSLLLTPLRLAGLGLAKLFLVNPWLGLAAAVTAAAAAAFGLGKAFASAGRRAAETAGAAREMAATLEKLRGGGPAARTDVKAVLGDEEYAKFLKKSPADRMKQLEGLERGERAKTRGLKEDEVEAARIRARKVLEHYDDKDFSEGDRKKRRSEELRRVLGGAGLLGRDLGKGEFGPVDREMVRVTGAGGTPYLTGGTLGKERIDAIVAGIGSGLTRSRGLTEVLKAAKANPKLLESPEALARGAGAASGEGRRGRDLSRLLAVGAQAGLGGRGGYTSIAEAGAAFQTAALRNPLQQEQVELAKKTLDVLTATYNDRHKGEPGFRPLLVE